MYDLILSLLKARLSTQQLTWLTETSEALLLSRYTAASRRLGKAALQLQPGEKARLLELNPDLELDHWGIDEAGRAVLLLNAAASMPDDDYERVVLQCYEFGDSRERQSWLRALSILPRCERFLSMAIDACRTNIIPLFEAIACENPYPARYFPELNFNQMVLKCMFNQVALRRIVGLKSRLNPELSRMATHYAAERKAAGREVPTDTGMVMS